MNDLDAKLEALTSQATALAPVPEVERVLRRGRHRRQRLAGMALICVLLAGVAAVGSWRTERGSVGTTAPVRPPAAAPVNRYIGWWQDSIDASVFLRQSVSPADRAALERRLASLPEVERVWYESQQQAFARFESSNRDTPLLANVTAKDMPESFRVTLRGPGSLARLRADLCTPKPPPGDVRPPPCSELVDSLVDQHALLFSVLSGRTWKGKVDVSVFLDPAVTRARTDALRRELAATPGVTSVAYESRAAAATRIRADFNAGQVRLMNPSGPAGVPSSFRLRLQDQATAARLHDAYCDNPTGTHDVCADGILLVIDEAWLEEHL